MNTLARIAVVEDSVELQEELSFFLGARGHAVWGAGSAEAFWKQLHRDPVDIVLLDVGLPAEDGFSVLEYLRGLAAHGTIVMTALGDRQHQQRGLELGADAYLVKPVNFARLAGVIDQLWERMRRQPGRRPALPGHWNLAAGELWSPAGVSLSLTPQEQAVLEVLLRSTNEICDKGHLYQQLFGPGSVPDLHRIDVIISRLRSKARQKNLSLPIRTVFGKGFVFVDRIT